jgi:hypothetical protein
MNAVSPSTTFRPDILGGDGGVSTATPPATGGDSFAWGTMGIGPPGPLVVRRRRIIAWRRPSASE